MKSVYILYLFAAATLLPRAGFAATYKFTTFEYPGSDATFYTGLDDYNRIVGYTLIGNSAPGFMITSAGMITTIAPAGAGVVSTSPAAINRNGGVVGSAFDGFNTGMFVDSGNGYRGLNQDLAVQTITGINSTSNSVGNFLPRNGGFLAAYLKYNGSYNTLLPADTCKSTSDPALNDYSTVVGTCYTGTSYIGFIWTKGKYTYIQPPANSSFLIPRSINNSGVVAGYYTDTSGSHGFVFAGTTFTTVDYPATGVNTEITGINNSGRIVGFYSGTHAIAFSAVAQ